MTLSKITSLKLYLDKLSELTEEDIQDVWIKIDEQKIVDLSTIKYSYDIELYQKMIFRFRNCEMSPSMLYNQVDPINKQIVLRYIMNKTDTNANTTHTYNDFIKFQTILDFFVWIKSAFSPYLLKDLIKENLETFVLIESLWKRNEIKLFFGVDEYLKLKLINMYNEMLDRSTNLILTLPI